MKLLGVFATILLLPALGFSATIVVPDDYATIQGAITAASNGDLVLVKPGTYGENINFEGKSITVRSDGDLYEATHDIAPNTTFINGGQTGPVVSFMSAEDSNSILEGFTILNGSGFISGPNTLGGGVFCFFSDPTIINNMIILNTADIGAGINCTSSAPTISGNTIRFNNASKTGGGINVNADATITNNTITENQAKHGAGIEVAEFSSPNIINNIIKLNTASLEGGGIRCNSASPHILNNLIKINQANKGGGLYCYTSSPAVTNNTIVGNSATAEGGGLHCFWYSFPVVTNGILWADTAATDSEIYADGTSTPVVSYCDVQGGYSGANNIDADPLFLDEPGENFHLTSGSPCLDVGDNASPTLPTTDFNFEARVNNIVDLGFDEFFAYPADELHVPSQYLSIQDAINAAPSASKILVATQFQNEGPYIENLDFLGKDIQVRSDIDSNPATHDINAAETIIDGGKSGSVVQFITGEATTSVLEGFTLKNGSGTLNSGSYYGGGIYCNLSSPSILNNIITGNNTEFGGGIYCEDSNPRISFNTIMDNNTAFSGGGIMCSASSPKINGNVIKQNEADFTGGGIDLFQFSSPQITNNIIHANSAKDGGGISCYRSSPDIINNTIYSNTALLTGGGLFCDYFSSPVTVANSINWANQAPSGPEVFIKGFSLVDLSHSDLMGGMLSVYVDPDSTFNMGFEVLDSDPGCLDAGNDVFVLSDDSLCINRGTPDGAPGLDIDGDLRPFMGTHDIGADEFVGTHSLEADVFTISEAVGGTVNFTMNTTSANAGRMYGVLAGVTGTWPGFSDPPFLVTLPINWDPFTDFWLTIFSLFPGLTGQLNAGGTSTGMLITGPLPPGNVGVKLYLALTCANPFNYVSTPIIIEIVP